MNLGVMRDEVLEEIGMSGDREETLVDRWLNQGVLKTVTLSLCEIESADVDLDVGEQDYESDPDILAVIDLFNLTDSLPLEKITWNRLTEMRARAADSGQVRYFAAKADTFRFYPAPGAATQITLYYVPKPALLVEDDDTPSSIPEEWHDLPVWWAMFRASSRDDDSSGQQGERYRNLFEDGLKKMRAAMKRKGGNKLAPGRLRTRTSALMSSDPSRDW